jgi:hypothetical protein
MVFKLELKSEDWKIFERKANPQGQCLIILVVGTWPMPLESGCKAYTGVDQMIFKTLLDSECKATGKTGDKLMGYLITFNLNVPNKGIELTFLASGRKEVTDLTLWITQFGKWAYI